MKRFTLPRKILAAERSPSAAIRARRKLTIEIDMPCENFEHLIRTDDDSQFPSPDPNRASHFAGECQMTIPTTLRTALLGIALGTAPLRTRASGVAQQLLVEFGVRQIVRRFFLI